MGEEQLLRGARERESEREQQAAGFFSGFGEREFKYQFFFSRFFGVCVCSLKFCLKSTKGSKMLLNSKWQGREGQAKLSGFAFAISQSPCSSLSHSFFLCSLLSFNLTSFSLSPPSLSPSLSLLLYLFWCLTKPSSPTQPP